MSLVLQPPAGAMARIPAWWSRDQFVDDVAALLTTPEADRVRRTQRVAASVVLEVARATATFAEQSTGRMVAVSNQVIADKVGRCVRVVQRARRVLEAMQVDVVLVEGRYLTVEERARAGGQIRAASTRCLTHPQGAARHRRLAVMPLLGEAPMTTDQPLIKWRVERALGPTGVGYLRGWFAHSRTGTGAYFTDWTEAINFATRQADLAFARMLTHHEAILVGTACRHELHEFCGADWCDCDCHREASA